MDLDFLDSVSPSQYLQQQPRPYLLNHFATPCNGSANGKVGETGKTGNAARSAHFDRDLASKYPLTFLVVEDNQINRKLLVNMLSKLGYRDIHEAYDGVDAVRQMQIPHDPPVDVILMDLWMPRMDGFEATRQILSMSSFPPLSSSSIATPRGRRSKRREGRQGDGVGEDSGGEEEEEEEDKEEDRVAGRRREQEQVTIIAVTADVTDEALEQAAQVGMKGIITKPFKLIDLQRSILEYCI